MVHSSDEHTLQWLDLSTHHRDFYGPFQIQRTISFTFLNLRTSGLLKLNINLLLLQLFLHSQLKLLRPIQHSQKLLIPPKLQPSMILLTLMFQHFLAIPFTTLSQETYGETIILWLTLPMLLLLTIKLVKDYRSNSLPLQSHGQSLGASPPFVRTISSFTVLTRIFHSEGATLRSMLSLLSILIPYCMRLTGFTLSVSLSSHVLTRFPLFETFNERLQKNSLNGLTPWTQSWPLFNTKIPSPSSIALMCLPDSINCQERVGIPPQASPQWTNLQVEVSLCGLVR
jgi:hypothetical protein